MYFDKLKLDEKALVFKGLKRLVENGEQAMFHNGDAGHPVYRMGAAGKSMKELHYAEIPTQNSAFLMLRELTLDLKDAYNDTIWWKDLSTWKSFCEFAVDCYKQRKDQRE